MRQHLRQFWNQAFHRDSRPLYHAGRRAKGWRKIRLTLDDVDLLTTNIPQITHITPSCDVQATLQYDTRTYTMSVNGEYPNTFNIRALDLDQGRFYNATDQMQRARVAVIGSETKEKLFSGRNPLGERLRVDGISFEVIGVLKAKMQAGDDNINRVVYIPFTTMSDLKDTHYPRHHLVQLRDQRLRPDRAVDALRPGNAAPV